MRTRGGQSVCFTEVCTKEWDENTHFYLERSRSGPFVEGNVHGAEFRIEATPAFPFVAPVVHCLHSPRPAPSNI